MADIKRLEDLAKLVRYYIMISTSEAGSGHPSSSLSATDLMTGLLFGGFFRFDPDQPGLPNNDRLVFSKGHASPLLYALWAAAGKVSEDELRSLRKFGSPLEGHPTMLFPYTEAATGSLGQGLSIGFGMALNAKYLDKLPYRTFVLLGDSEMAEGSQWESLQLAVHYRLDNLIGIIDVNRLGQRGETMYGHDLSAYERRVSAFGWKTVVIDGHNMGEIAGAFEKATAVQGRPVMIISKTFKGKGIGLLENRDGWHGKAIEKEKLPQALADLGVVDTTLRGTIAKPEPISPQSPPPAAIKPLAYDPAKPVATRRAYGNALARLGAGYPRLVALDGEVSNSTYAEVFRDAFPDRYFEMYVAEQNMAGAAIGLARRGKIPFVSSFAAFLTRAFDQIRMGRYSEADVKYCGSHAGVSIGEDGTSQMGLEDIAMFRTLLDSVVLYPSDAVSTELLVEAAIRHQGTVYIRTTRAATPILYSPDDTFIIGGSKVLRMNSKDAVTVVGAGITLHEALKAYDALKAEGIPIRVIDLYSIKPADSQTLVRAAAETAAVITVEDHYAEGGIGEAVRSALAGKSANVISLAVRRMPRSGRPDELMEYEEISSASIIKTVKSLIATS